MGMLAYLWYQWHGINNQAPATTRNGPRRQRIFAPAAISVINDVAQPCVAIRYRIAMANEA